MKRCSCCKTKKDYSCFTKNRAHKDGFANQCKTCKSSTDKKWKINNPELVRNQQLKYTYGIGISDYSLMFTEQAGRCAICNDLAADALCIDHDHISKKIRKLLCNPCNAAIGMLKDNSKIVTRAAEYLREHGK